MKSYSLSIIIVFLFYTPGLLQATERFFTVDLSLGEEVHSLKVQVDRFPNENTFVTIFDPKDLMRKKGSQLTLHIAEDHLTAEQVMAYLQTIYAAKNNFTHQVLIDFPHLNMIHQIQELWNYRELNLLLFFSAVGADYIKIQDHTMSLGEALKQLPDSSIPLPSKIESPSNFMVTGSTHPQLRDKIISSLKKEGLTPYTPSQEEGDNFTNKKIFVVGTPALSVNGKGPDADDHLFTALQETYHYSQRGGEVILVWGYKPYARSDKKDDQKKKFRKVAIYSAMTDLLEKTAGAQGLIYVRAHVSQSQGFTHLPTINISLHDILGDYLKQTLSVFHIVAPDAGAEKDDTLYAERMGVSLSVLMKYRNPITKEIKMKNYGVDSLALANDVVAIIDDETASGSTLANAASILKDNGAQKVVAAVVHLSGNASNAFKAMDQGLIDSLVVTDTMPHAELVDPRIKVVSVADKIAEEIATFLR